MRFYHTTLLAAALVNASGVLAAPVIESRQSASSPSSSCNLTNEPIPPSEDPWYTAPYEFEKEHPGTILRVRPALGNLSTIAGNCSAAYNILYRTTSSTYGPTWAVTTLFIPKNVSAPSASSGSLLSYQIPYDSNDVDSGPSYALYAGVGSDISDSLGKGWFVNVPDYEGPLASFTAGVISGHATIDSVRAVLSGASRFGLPANTSYALWGYSGGALASEWAAELQVQYAPELDFSGAALGGLTPNITNVLLTINGGAAAGLAPAAIMGITSQFPDVRSYVLSKLKTSGPYNATSFVATQNYSINGEFSAFAFKNISAYFEDGFEALLSPVTQKAINSDGIMGYHGVPQMPIYAYKAVKDEVSPIADTDALVNRYCLMGANILYERNSIGGHSADATNGRPAALDFLSSIFSGTYASKYSTEGCTIKNVTVNITSSNF